MAPIYPAYHMAQSILGLKSAWEKAQAKKGGAQPTIDEVIAAFEGHRSPTPERQASAWRIGNGHQGIADTAYGTFRFNKAEKQAGDRRHRALSGRVREPAGRHDLDGVARRPACPERKCN